MSRIYRKKLVLLVTGVLLTVAASGTEATVDEDGVTAPDNPRIANLIADAKAGDPGVQYLLGYMYAEGQAGLNRDIKKAVQWYTSAAEQGHIEAKVTLGMMYAEGKELPKDWQRAVRWYTKAAEQGNGGAQSILSTMYANALPTAHHLIQAYKWTLLAETNGKDVADRKRWLAERMAPEQIDEARNLADAFTAAAAVETESESVVPDGAVKYIFEEQGFSLAFPGRPQRTIAQDNDRLTAIHYQSIPRDSTVQYNASFQTFKQQKLLTESAQQTYLNDYLVGRAMVAWRNNIQIRHTSFRGFNAVMFKHITHTPGAETMHEGLVFIFNGDAVCLTCVYPAERSPVPTFYEFINSFEQVSAETTESDQTQEAAK